MTTPHDQSRADEECPSRIAAEGRMTVARLDAFGRAWSARDIDTLMSFMTDDCVYHASVGPEPGETFVGREEVRRGFEKMLAYDLEAERHSGQSYVHGDRGTAEWAFGYVRNGKRFEVRGCDLFEFSGDKIRVKNAFRKTFDR